MPDVRDDVLTLSYDEIAERFGIERESARQLVLRKHWKRLKGNDGRARVEVPLDALPADTSNSMIENTSDEQFDRTAELAELTRALTRHIERLEQTLTTYEEKAVSLASERDEARDEARVAKRATEEALHAGELTSAQVKALENILELERRRLEELNADRDRWRAQAERSWWRRLVG